MSVHQFGQHEHHKANQGIHLVPFNEIKMDTQRRDLVKGLIPRNGITVVWGPPKTAKSFIMLDMMLHVALGWPYRGRRVHQGPIVYCAFEGQGGIAVRCEAFRQTFLSEDHGSIPFYVEPVTIDLIKDKTELILAVQQTLGETRPVAIVLDTLNRSLVGSESSDEDMGAYIKAADAIRVAFDCAVIIVHHCGLDATRPRGHTSLPGAVEAQLSVKRKGGDIVVMTVELAKDSPQGEAVVSRIETVEVGIDEDGDPMTSCVVRPVDGDIPTDSTLRRLSDRQKLAMDALAESILSASQPAPTSFQLRDHVRLASVDDWRAEMVRRGVIDRDAKNPRQDFKRIREALLVKKLIGERDSLVWLASDALTLNEA